MNEVMQEELSDVLPQYREAENRLGMEARLAHDVCLCLSRIGI